MSEETHKPGENCARDLSKVVWECFGGIGKVAQDFYSWWDKTREENVWIGIGIAILLVLGAIFILLPAALVLLIVAGCLFIGAVIIDSIYGKPESAGDAPKETKEEPAAETPKEEEEETKADEKV